MLEQDSQTRRDHIERGGIHGCGLGDWLQAASSRKSTTRALAQ
jgi:hypothetical protein